MFYYGHHVKEDKDAAFFWYRKANKHTIYEYETLCIQYRLGKCYLYGHSVEKDILRAFGYLYSAKKGLPKQLSGGEPDLKLTLQQTKKELNIARHIVYKNE